MKFEYMHQSHSVSLLVVHFVITTKHRKSTLPEDITVDFFRKCIEKYPIKIACGEIGEDLAHLHLMLQIPCTMSMAQVAQAIKGISSKEIKQINPNWQGWSRGYFVSSVAEQNSAVIENYIKNQRNKD